MAGALTDEYTYDVALEDGGPVRPDLAALGGADFRDSTGSPPQKGRDPYAGLYSEHSRNLAGLNKFVPTARIWMEWVVADSEWTIIGVDAMGTLVDEDSFEVTPMSTGVLSISWAAGTLPPMQRKPLVTVTDDYGRGYGIVTGANEINVRLHDEDKVAADLNFVVDII